jgi:TusA-related sulfurtransferase
MANEINVQKIGERLYTIDVRGHVCPYPELLSLRAIQSLSTGDTLEVILDNAPSVRDIPITIEKRAYGKTDVKRVNNKTWKIIVQI